MSLPPEKLDGAEVIEWSWSGLKPFGFVGDESGTIADWVFGIAICRYSNSPVVYRFSCNEMWEVIQDSDYVSVEEAKNCLPEQYKMTEAEWIRRD